MVKQRWAALSVIDHIDTAKLIPDILMYDRLVVPTPSPKANWPAEWNSKLQEERLKMLGEELAFDDHDMSPVIIVRIDQFIIWRKTSFFYHIALHRATSNYYYLKKNYGVRVKNCIYYKDAKDGNYV